MGLIRKDDFSDFPENVNLRNNFGQFTNERDIMKWITLLKTLTKFDTNQ